MRDASLYAGRTSVTLGKGAEDIRRMVVGTGRMLGAWVFGPGWRLPVGLSYGAGGGRVVASLQRVHDPVGPVFGRTIGAGRRRPGLPRPGLSRRVLLHARRPAACRRARPHCRVSVE